MSHGVAVTALAELVEWLGLLEEREARNERSIKKTQLRERVLSDFDRADPKLLANQVKRKSSMSGEFGESMGYLFGPVSESGGVWLPIFSLYWDFERSNPVLRVRVAMCAISADDRLVSQGVRFETPESFATGSSTAPSPSTAASQPVRFGSHDYFHSQPIVSFTKNGRDLPGCAPSNTSQPAVPVDADCSISLLIACLISLYDISFVREGIGGMVAARGFAKGIRCLVGG